MTRQRRLRHPTPQVQVPLAARPRNHFQPDSTLATGTRLFGSSNTWSPDETDTNSDGLRTRAVRVVVPGRRRGASSELPANQQLIDSYALTMENIRKIDVVSKMYEASNVPEAEE